jgi:hypothetical protein
MHGQGIDGPLSELSSKGVRLPEDAPRVRTLAESMIHESDSSGGK